MERVILHADLNNFYASVECLYQPALRGEPVAVAGDPAARHGIVLAKNELAKRWGVQTGDPLWLARQKCPALRFVPPHYDRYLRYSRITREICQEYTSQVEPFGLDECWLDVTGSRHLFGAGQKIADQLRRRIRTELGVTASVGVSFNKVFAKLGSDMKKPDATTCIPRADYRTLVWPLPVEALLYVGGQTREKLGRYGVRTIGDLARADAGFLQRLLGKNGVALRRFANGEDRSPVAQAGEVPAVKSIGNGVTAPHDLVTAEEVRITLYDLCESVAARLREQNVLCGTVQLGVRTARMAVYERQGKLPHPTRTAQALFDRAYTLFERQGRQEPIRSLRVRVSALCPDDYEQLPLFSTAAASPRQAALERTVEQVRSWFGPAALRRGLALTDRALADMRLNAPPVAPPGRRIG